MLRVFESVDDGRNCGGDAQSLCQGHGHCWVGVVVVVVVVVVVDLFGMKENND